MQMRLVLRRVLWVGNLRGQQSPKWQVPHPSTPQVQAIDESTIGVEGCGASEFSGGTLLHDMRTHCATCRGERARRVLARQRLVVAWKAAPSASI